MKLFSSKHTFKPKKSHTDEKRVKLHKYAKATLGAGDLKSAVKLPLGEDLNEWLAVNTVDFFNQINILYGNCSFFCTNESCPIMTAGKEFEYQWSDGKSVSKVSAPQYVELLMVWVQDQMDNEAIFPSHVSTPFPKDFQKILGSIFRRLFRVYAHIYHHHFEDFARLGHEARLNTCFKHFYYFVIEFNLVPKEELIPLEDIYSTYD